MAGELIPESHDKHEEAPDPDEPECQAYPPVFFKTLCKFRVSSHDVADHEKDHVVEKIRPGSFTLEEKSETYQKDRHGDYKYEYAARSFTHPGQSTDQA